MTMYESKKPQELEISDSFHSELESAQVKDTYPLLFMFISRNWDNHFKYSKQRLNYFNNLGTVS